MAVPRPRFRRRCKMCKGVGNSSTSAQQGCPRRPGCKVLTGPLFGHYSLEINGSAADTSAMQTCFPSETPGPVWGAFEVGSMSLSHGGYRNSMGCRI